jgi:hypothetical protein
MLDLVTAGSLLGASQGALAYATTPVATSS